MDIGCGNKNTDQKKHGRKYLDGNIKTIIDRHNIGRHRHTEQRTESFCFSDQQKNSTNNLGKSHEIIKAIGKTKESPCKSHGRRLTVGFCETVFIWSGKLGFENFY